MFIVYVDSGIKIADCRVVNMGSSIQVSLLIPTFNNADTAYAAIRSCVLQSFKDIEIIVYDEASIDGTREVIDKAAKEDGRIRVLTSEINSGPVNAWRRLLTEAKGKYFTFVWSDDLLMPEYVERMKAMLDANPDQLLAGCNAYSGLVSDNWEAELQPGHSNRKLTYQFHDMALPGEVYALGLLAGFFPITQICSLYRTAEALAVFDHFIQFENPYGFDYTRRAYGNDVSYLSELALRSGTITLTGDPLVILRAGKNSMTAEALVSHKFDFWLQYVWAIRSAWLKNQSMSSRMRSLVEIATDRLHLCDVVAAVANKRRPIHYSPHRVFRALWFMIRFDRRVNRKAKIESLASLLKV